MPIAVGRTYADAVAPTRNQHQVKKAVGMYCKDCGSTVTATDRFCPACGTPNVSCKFQPKFGPALKIMEPRIVIEPVAAGAPSCPRCHRLIERPDEHCRGCGMVLQAAWDRFDRVRVLDAWRRSGLPVPAYRGLDRLVWVTLAVLGLGAGLAVLLAVGQFGLVLRQENLLPGAPAASELLDALRPIQFAMWGLFAVGAALVVTWMRLAYRNLTALAVGDLRFNEHWVVWGWLVPGINLFRPKQIIDDLWRASHPLAPPFSSSWRVGPAPVWSIVWWSTLLIGGSLALVSELVTPTSAAVGTSNARPTLVLASCVSLLLAGSAWSLRMLIQQVNLRQNARAAFITSVEDEPGETGDTGETTDAGAVGASGGFDVTELHRALVHSAQERVYGRY